MKSNKQKKIELRQKRQGKSEKKSLGRQKHSIPVNFERLSEESKRSWTIPSHYTDQTYKCVDCGQECLFLAETQKEWYEIKKRYYWQHPIRCLNHHKKWLSTRKHKFEMGRNIEALSQNPESEELMGNCAESIIQFHKDTGTGNLKTALHLLKKLNRTDSFYTYCKSQLTGS
ncbi:MAG: zinc-ribbon domain containing protein [Lentisphaeraceae bacterium]|nr:zinc-ribbon domain containing protein [Lentisphaeraceae bacterium]